MQIFTYNSKGIPSQMSTQGRQQVVKKAQILSTQLKNVPKQLEKTRQRDGHLKAVARQIRDAFYIETHSIYSQVIALAVQCMPQCIVYIAPQLCPHNWVHTAQQDMKVQQSAITVRIYIRHVHVLYYTACNCTVKQTFCTIHFYLMCTLFFRTKIVIKKSFFYSLEQKLS